MILQFNLCPTSYLLQLLIHHVHPLFQLIILEVVMSGAKIKSFANGQPLRTGIHCSLQRLSPPKFDLTLENSILQFFNMGKGHIVNTVPTTAFQNWKSTSLLGGFNSRVATWCLLHYSDNSNWVLYVKTLTPNLAIVWNTLKRSITLNPPLTKISARRFSHPSIKGFFHNFSKSGVLKTCLDCRL